MVVHNVMSNIIEKVTAFVTRQTSNGIELLLFQHPHAGIQIPAGIVEPGESPEEAALREVREETGLTNVDVGTLLGINEEKLPENMGIIIPPVILFARPDRTSFDWINIRSAVEVQIDRRMEGFTQVTYIEHDRVPNPNYVSLQITGWVRDDKLADTRRRFFFLLEFAGQSQDRWKTFSDNHTFSPFWAPLNNLPEIISPQDTWLKYLRKHFC